MAEFRVDRVIGFGQAVNADRKSDHVPRRIPNAWFAVQLRTHDVLPEYATLFGVLVTKGFGVSVAEGVEDSVSDGSGVSVAEGVEDGVSDGSSVSVADGVKVSVSDGSGVSVADGVKEGVSVAEGADLVGASAPPSSLIQPWAK